MIRCNVGYCDLDKETGYKYQWDNTLLTIESSPNIEAGEENKGCVVVVDKDLSIKINSFGSCLQKTK